MVPMTPFLRIFLLHNCFETRQNIRFWFSGRKMDYHLLLKFRYSEKATKFEKNLPLLSTFTVKFKVEDFFKFCGLLRISELYSSEPNRGAGMFINFDGKFPNFLFA